MSLATDVIIGPAGTGKPASWPLPPARPVITSAPRDTPLLAARYTSWQVIEPQVKFELYFDT